MTFDDFEPPMVPLCSQALVRTLKTRLIETIETGKATEAKAFLDIIDRLARMNWLDEATDEERFERDQRETEAIRREIDAKILALLAQPD
jgi:hypothetical protein